MANPVSVTIRAKKLGVLIKDARMAAGKSTLECAQAIGATEEMFLAYEAGDHSPSLPEVEMLAFYLQIPLEHFWGGETLKSDKEATPHTDPKMLLGIRHRMVGVLLRKARTDANLSMEELGARSGLSPEALREYELGTRPLPVPELDALAAALGYPLRHFQDQRGPIGAWMSEQRAVQDFKKLSPELQAFITRPVNRPYLELAQRLSEMSVEKLRAVAEGLLEITL